MSTALDVSLKVLYVQGPAAEVDRTATEQLRKASAELQITTIAGSAAALAELRRTPGWQALFASPSLPQNEVLALIASLRRDRIPIAIVPILDDIHQDLFASAVATGADDVLVRRNGTLVNINETLTRIRQSPHLFPAEQRRRISVLYAGRDPLVWNLLDQVPFVKADRVATGIDGTCSVRRPGAGDDSLRADAVIIDETPGDAHPLQVLKSVKAQASDLPVIMLTSAGAADIATAALELGADDTVLKTGIFRRRLIATLRRVHQRLELTAQQHETKTREERLRQIVENVPTGIMVVAGDGRVLAMNAAALHLFAASKPRDIVGRDFRDLVDAGARDSMTELIRQVTKGEAGGLTFEARTLAGDRLQAHIDAVVLERDARGGRGLVASITRAVQAPADAETDARASAELATLRDALQTLERHYGELEDARTLERAAWESERQRLEARLEEAERLAAERRTIEERLAEVTAELARTSQSFAAERQALELRLQELDTAAREASAVGAARAELEQALEAVREEQRQAIAAHALERSGWQDIRAELEARVQQLDQLHQSEQDTLVASLQQDVQRLEQTLNEERVRWQATREQLEAELRNAREALWAEHTERDATRATFEAELTALRTALEDERASWRQVRDTVEDELSSARAAVASAEADRDRVRAELEQELREARGAIETERGDWQATRQTLEDARRQVEVALEHERAEWTERRLAFEDERRQLLERGVQAGDLAAERSRLATELETARQQWAAERAAIEGELARAREQAERAEESLRALADEYDATRARLEQERDRASAELTDVRVVIEAQVAHLEAELAAARDQAAALTAEHDAFRHRSMEDLSALEQTRKAEREDWERQLTVLESSLAETTAAVSQRESGWEQERSQLLQAAADARTYAEQERGHLVSLHARELEEWRQAVEQARSERDQAASRLSSIEADLDTARRQIVELDYVRAALELARADQDQAHQRARALDTELQTVTSQHQAEIDSLRAALEAARADHAHAQQRISALEADLDGARQQLAELDPLRAALEVARADHAHAQQRISALEADLDGARQQLAELDPLRAALEAARADHAHAQQRISALEADLDGARQQLAELDPLRAALEAARADHAHAQQRISALEADLDGARQQLAELDPLRAALEAARADHAHAQQRISALEADLDSARQQLAELDPLRAALEAARADHAHAQQRISALEADLDSARQQLAELDPLRAALEAARADHAHAQQRISALEADLDGARQQLAELDPLRAALEAARADHDHAEHRLHAVETELGELRLLASEHQNLLDALEAARSEIRHTDAAHHAEREEWHHSRQALERDLRELEANLHNERDSLSRIRAELEAEAAAAATLVREQQFLNDTIASLRADCSALASSLADERADHDRHQHELDALRVALEDSRAHLAEMDAALDRAARSADEQLAQQRARHEARERALEEQVRDLSALLDQARADTESVRAALQSSYTRASENHARLVASDAFGYAVTTMAGELVRCNDAFARVFGYADATEAQSRTAGRSFPGLAARPDISARLATEGRVERVVSCVERIDGRAVRIIESAVVLAGERDGDPSLVEHIVVAGPAGPTPEEIQSRRLKDVGALTTAMMPELESLSSTLEARSTDVAKTADGRGTAAHDSDQLRAASGQVATLIRQLAAFSRRQVRGPEAIDLGDAVRAAEAVLTRLVGDYIGFATDLGPTTPVTTQPDDLDQLLTSMVTLGRDLLPAGGSITVQVRQQDAASAGASGVPGPVLAVKASGYGVQFPGATAALDLVAERCGGTVHVSGETGRVVRIEVLFPRCGLPAHW